MLTQPIGQNQVAAMQAQQAALRTMRSDLNSLSKGQNMPEAEIVLAPIVREADQEDGAKAGKKHGRVFLTVFLILLIAGVLGYFLLYPLARGMFEASVI